MVASRGPSDIIAEEDLLKRLFADYGVPEHDEDARLSFVHKHLKDLEASENEVVARTGFVLKRAYEGYALGYRVPMAVIAMGRAMLGIDLAIAAPLLTANPAAFTCAAAAAVYYGYAALSEGERAELTALVAGMFKIGVELIKNIADFFITTMKSVFDSDLLRQLKECLAEAADRAGTSLYEITGSLKDRAYAIASSARSGATWFVSSTGEAVSSAAEGVSKVAVTWWTKGKRTE